MTAGWSSVEQLRDKLSLDDGELIDLRKQVVRRMAELHPDKRVGSEFETQEERESFYYLNDAKSYLDDKIAESYKKLLPALRGTQSMDAIRLREADRKRALEEQRAILRLEYAIPRLTSAMIAAALTSLTALLTVLPSNPLAVAMLEPLAAHYRDVEIDRIALAVYRSVFTLVPDRIELSVDPRDVDVRTLSALVSALSSELPTPPLEEPYPVQLPWEPEGVLMIVPVLTPFELAVEMKRFEAVTEDLNNLSKFALSEAQKIATRVLVVIIVLFSAVYCLLLLRERSDAEWGRILLTDESIAKLADSLRNEARNSWTAADLLKRVRRKQVPIVLRPFFGSRLSASTGAGVAGQLIDELVAKGVIQRTADGNFEVTGVASG